MLSTEATSYLERTAAEKTLKDAAASAEHAAVAAEEAQKVVEESRAGPIPISDEEKIRAAQEAAVVAAEIYRKAKTYRV